VGTVDVEGGLQVLDSITAGERDCQVLLSSDSLGMLFTFNKVLFEAEPTARAKVRQKEPDLQREVERVIARMCTRGFDFALSHEEACHNRERKGRTDGARHMLARFNHAVDLLAGIMVNMGRNRDLAFYGAMQPLQRA
jgi:hypothetical protein